eukprot:GEMP01065348.1.p1 GENE.GEMP01065348.1~~GEMP01065348.1.p1  ORF type:complete len:116 (+),score=16.91 GEMP01065348.1:386-733(+)
MFTLGHWIKNVNALISGVAASSQWRRGVTITKMQGKASCSSCNFVDCKWIADGSSLWAKFITGAERDEQRAIVGNRRIRGMGGLVRAFSCISRPLNVADGELLWTQSDEKYPGQS